MAYFFIADTHFGHENALAFDNRPFRTIEEHDKALIENWNNAVSRNDEVFILGDISWHNATRTNEIVSSLNGVKHLIVGNHDKKLLKNREFQSLFIEITDYKELSLSDKKGIVLSHYPIPCFNHHYYGWYHLYGHVHISFEWNMMERVKYEMETLYDKPCRMYNCGAMIDYIGYTPRTLGEILASQEAARQAWQEG
ncbi:MAG: hypothetical protein HFH92_03220 [Lachnospiraceae bacterium]|jgi:calcineurin-like phosphoesterase family protein|uniref:metallophosphoesterase family protein n=1 Tax=uncultured Acetatifactor sp. TaxID=1671927 RepID=UPI0026073292|nr:metallophosphoesterase family protein [uncultured Acetatifactor sp.]MCI8788117.1 hypothetical protein [Lachnospiraceae bacterium]